MSGFCISGILTWRRDTLVTCAAHLNHAAYPAIRFFACRIGLGTVNGEFRGYSRSPTWFSGASALRSASLAPAQRFLSHSSADDCGHALARHRLRARGLHCVGFWSRPCDRRLRCRFHDSRLAELSGGGRNCFHHLRFDLHAVSRGEAGTRRGENFLRHHHGDDGGAGGGNFAGGNLHAPNHPPHVQRIHRRTAGALRAPHANSSAGATFLLCRWRGFGGAALAATVLVSRFRTAAVQRCNHSRRNPAFAPAGHFVTGLGSAGRQLSGAVSHQRRRRSAHRDWL